jgi:hypothetical protein
VKEDEMGGYYSMYGRDKKCIQYFSWKARRGKAHSEHLGIDGMIILECTCEKCGKAWIGLIWLKIGNNDGLL